MEGAILKKKKTSLIGIGVVIGVLLFSSLANAATLSPDLGQRPDWWDDADARVIFDPLPTEDILAPTPSEGTQGYDYTAYYSVFPGFTSEITTLNILLGNDENPDKTTLFWMAFRYNSLFKPQPSFVTIRGHKEDGSVSKPINFNSFRVDQNWVYAEASLSSQPDKEEISILVKAFNTHGLPLYDVDYLEVGTYSTPIPSSLFLLGGGIFWIVNLKRRKS